MGKYCMCGCGCGSDMPTPNKVNICSRRSDADETNDDKILTLAHLLCKMRVEALRICSGILCE